MRDKFNLEKSENWYLHNHQTVTENFNHKLLWDMYIQRDNIIVERRPDIVTVKKMLEDYKIIDLAIPGDKRIINKEKDRTEMYWNLKIEILRLWNLKKIDVMPVVLGAPRSATKNLKICRYHRDYIIFTYCTKNRIIRGSKNIEKGA